MTKSTENLKAKAISSVWIMAIILTSVSAIWFAGFFAMRAIDHLLFGDSFLFQYQALKISWVHAAAFISINLMLLLGKNSNFDGWLKENNMRLASSAFFLSGFLVAFVAPLLLFNYGLYGGKSYGLLLSSPIFFVFFVLTLQKNWKNLVLAGYAALFAGLGVLFSLATTSFDLLRLFPLLFFGASILNFVLVFRGNREKIGGFQVVTKLIVITVLVYVLLGALFLLLSGLR